MARTNLASVADVSGHVGTHMDVLSMTKTLGVAEYVERVLALELLEDPQLCFS